MDFNDIDKNHVDRETNFYENTAISAANLNRHGPSETEEAETDEGLYEELRTVTQTDDSRIKNKVETHRSPRSTQQGDTDKRTKYLIYINLSLVSAVYVVVIALIVVAATRKEQDDAWPKWGSWGPCSTSCGGGIMSRNRSCSDSLIQQQGCTAEEISLCNTELCPATDGGWSIWESWSICSESCGGGIMSRNRTCSNPVPQGLGVHCIGNSDQIGLCNKQPCPGTDGGWSSWDSWGICSVSCGGGIKSRLRTCSYPLPSGLGRQCIGNSEQVGFCNKYPCLGTDGEWSSWAMWSICSGSCGGGIMSRNRTCSNPVPSGHGRQCVGNSEQVGLCNQQPCNGTDGGWSSWENWSNCSESCGGGIKSRNRTCSNPKPSMLGKQCVGNSEQVSLCNKHICKETEYNVAFMAYGVSRSPVLFYNTTLQFRYVYLNNGNGYDNRTGIFKCNVSGVYHFVITLTIHYEDNATVHAYLRVNNVTKVTLRFQPKLDDSNEVGAYVISGAGTFHLDRNDAVDVYGVPNYFYDNFYSSFTGFLITPDQ